LFIKRQTTRQSARQNEFHSILAVKDAESHSFELDYLALL
jgi:hypothetical protein